MGDADYFALGDWNSNCSMCGRKRKASEMVRNWQGMYRCPEHDEPRHPQDFVRGVPDVQTPPWTQEAGISYVGVCSPNNTTGIIGWGVIGCFIVGYTSPLFDPTITNP